MFRLLSLEANTVTRKFSLNEKLFPIPDFTHLQNVPVDDRPPRILDHLLPVLQLQSLPVVAHLHPPDGVGAADPVIVRHHQLQTDSLQVSEISVR